MGSKIGYKGRGNQMQAYGRQNIDPVPHSLIKSTLQAALRSATSISGSRANMHQGMSSHRLPRLLPRLSRISTPNGDKYARYIRIPHHHDFDDVRTWWLLPEQQRDYPNLSKWRLIYSRFLQCQHQWNVCFRLQTLRSLIDEIVLKQIRWR